VSVPFLVDEPVRLLAFLRRALPAWKRTTLEQRIRAGCVRVNGATRVKNDLLAPGDRVEVVDPALAELGPQPPPAGLALLHEDDALIAVDKPAGLLSVAAEGERERTAHALLRAATSGELWPVHRLDRETSGVLLFAKTRAARDAVQSAWGTVRKTYLALVEGRPTPPEGVIEEPLWEDAQLFVHAGRRDGAKDARTRYRTLATSGGRSLLEVELDTGRRHQIRVHMAWLGHPIAGDARYGKKGELFGLHALRLVVPHPSDGRLLTLEAPPPRRFGLARGPAGPRSRP
jgi:23S rRNA pseudouridine1911/1915/1917 synthase